MKINNVMLPVYPGLCNQAVRSFYGLLFTLLFLTGMPGKNHASESTDTDPWREKFEEAYMTYFNHHYDEAGQMFQNLEKSICAADHIVYRCLEARLYAFKSKRQTDTFNPEDWDPFYRSWKEDFQHIQEQNPGDKRVLFLEGIYTDTRLRISENLDLEPDEVFETLDSLDKITDSDATPLSTLIELNTRAELLSKDGAYEELVELVVGLNNGALQISPVSEVQSADTEWTATEVQAEVEAQGGIVYIRYLTGLRQMTANSLQRLGRVDEAISLYTKDLYELRSLVPPDHYLLNIALANIGTGYYIAGQYSKAVNYFQSAFQTLKNYRFDTNPQKAILYRNIGTTYYMLKEFGLAGEYLEKGQRTLDEIGGDPTITAATTYSIVAQLYREDGNLEAAENAYLESISVRREVMGLGHPDEVRTLINLGNLFVEMGKTTEAEEILWEAKRVAEEHFSASHPIFLEMGIQMGSNLAAKGDISEGWDIIRTLLQNAGLPLTDHALSGSGRLKMFRQVSDPVMSLNALLLGTRMKKDLFDETGERKHAEDGLTWVDTAIALIEYLQQDENDEESASDRHHNYYEVHTLKLDLLYRLHTLEGNRPEHTRIFETMEYARSRLASILLNELESESSTVLSPERFQERRSLYTKRIELRKGLMSAAGDSLQRELLLVDEAIARLEDSIARDYPEYHAQIYDFSVPELQEVQKALKDDEVMILYMLSVENVYALVVSGESVHIRRVGDVQKMRLQLESTIGFMMRLDRLEDREAVQLRTTLEELYGMLIAPLESLIAGKDLIILPDQKLHYLPFDLLLTESVDHVRYDEWPFLIRRHAVAMVQSVKFWLKRDRNRQEPSRELLAMAPFTDYQTAGGVAGGGVGVEWRVTGSGDGGGSDGGGSDGVADTEAATKSGRADQMLAAPYEPLLMSAIETSRIQEIVSEGRSQKGRKRTNLVTVLQGGDATRSAFHLASPEEYRIIHFSTHASLVDSDPHLSYLALHPGDPETQLLYAGDVYGLDLSADLVVLSACETGLGEYVRGDGLVGFTRAFFYAGARNVIASMWKVNDRSTAVFMIEFYKYIMEGYSYRESIRLAKLALIEHPQFNAPFYWAAFQLQEGFR